MDKESIVKQIRRKLFGALNRGDRYTCPFCLHSYRKFLSGGARAPELSQYGTVGIGRRLNARCPHCGANDRARLVFLYLRTTECFSQTPLRILDIGPDRHVARTLRQQPTVEYVCGDLFPEAYADLKASKVDVTNIPFEKDSFDVLLCNHVLQQVPDDRLAIREIARVLKPGGWGIVQVPLAIGIEQTLEDASVNTPHERRRRFGSTNHVRLYGRDYADRLRNEGLIVIPTHPIQDKWCADAERYAVIANENIFVVRKKPLNGIDHPVPS